MSHDKIQQIFDGWAEEGTGDRLEHAHGDVVEQVVDKMNIHAGEKILDLGCGTGWATRMLAKAAPGVQAIGIDLAPQMIARADELHSFTIRARYDLGTFEALDFEDASFDRAFSMEALYYSPHVDKALEELLRVLKPGAPADVIIDYFEDSPGTARWAELMDVAMCSKSEAGWKAAFEEAGFTNVKTARIVDRRGPGEEAAFEPDEWTPDWATQVSIHENGSLWIHAEKPA